MDLIRAADERWGGGGVRVGQVQWIPLGGVKSVKAV